MRSTGIRFSPLSLAEICSSRSRFHYSTRRPDEPWHLTCLVGNRRTWNRGEGFFRHDIHVYANDNKLSGGYQGYSRFNETYQWDGYKELLTLPAANYPKYTKGTRNYLRQLNYRHRVHAATLRELQLPREPLFDAIRPEERDSDCRNNNSSARRRLVKEPAFTEMLEALRKGTLKPPKPSLGLTVPSADGKPVPLEQAIADAERVGDSALHDFLAKKLEAFSRRDSFQDMEKNLRRRF